MSPAPHGAEFVLVDLRSIVASIGRKSEAPAM
jgi:hypothetical protein